MVLLIKSFVITPSWA